MNPITHALTGWALAATPDSQHRDRLLVTLAAVVPDLDGLGIFAELATRESENPLYWWSLFHHRLGHNLLVGVVVTLMAAAFSRRRWRTTALVFLSFHLHLLGDLVGSRGPDGYQWPIPYFFPFSPSPQLTWEGQWALNAWPNVALGVILLFWALWIAWSKGYSPLSLISDRADRSLVEALRNRFGSPLEK